MRNILSWESEQVELTSGSKGQPQTHTSEGDGRTLFLATLVALHFTPVSKSVSQSAEFRTSVASRLSSLLFWKSYYETW